MNGWLVVFEHRFPDLHPWNFRALPGQLLSHVPAPEIVENPPGLQTLHHARFREGSFLHYDLTDDVEATVALRLECRFRTIAGPDYSSETHTIVANSPTAFANFGLQIENGSLQVMFSGQRLSWPGFDPEDHRWRRVLWEWESTGRSVLGVDGQVVAVRADHQRSISTNVPGVIVGSSHARDGAGNSIFPQRLEGDIAYVSLHALPQHSTLRLLSGPAPTDPVLARKWAACQPTVAGGMSAHHALFFSLWTEFVANGVDNWTLGEGGQPFSRDAIIFHHRARRLSELVGEYLLGRGSAEDTLRRIVALFNRMIDALERGLGDAGAARLQEALAQATSMQPDEECLETARRVEESREKEVAGPNGASRLQKVLEALADELTRRFGG